MRKLLLFFFLLSSPFLYSQDDQIPVIGSQSYYPLPKDGRWYFSVRPDSLETTSNGYDTILFCSTPFSNPFYLALTGNKYVLFAPQLKEISRGDYRKHTMRETIMYLQSKSYCLVFDFLKSSIDTLQIDSFEKVDQTLYIYRNGKMGLIEYETIVDPIYDRIIPFQDLNNNHPKDLYLVLKKGKFGLIDQKGEEVIPVVASIIQHDQFGIIKYKEGTWKYLLPDEITIEPDGKEIHFFSGDTYKMYNVSRTKAKLYVKGKEVQSTNTYDDIFDLEVSYAVRKNDKIGLIDKKYRLLKSPFCDQIELIGDNSNNVTYKYLLDNNWGVMSDKGQVLIQAKFANVLGVHKIKNQTRYKVAQNGKIGVIDKNAEFVLQPKYFNIQQQGDGYIVELNKRLGYLSESGDEVLKIEYGGHNSVYGGIDFPSSITAFVKNQQYYFVNDKAEILKIKACLDYSFGNNILKCYYNDRIEVHFIEQGKITETNTYNQVKSVNFVTNRHPKHHLSGFHVSTLELNQLTGLYAMRNQITNGFAHEPIFPYFQESCFRNWFDAGEFSDSNYVFQIGSFPKLNAYRVFNWMCQNNGELKNDLVLYSNVFKSQDGWRSSTDCSILNAEKTMQWVSPGRKDIIDPSIAVNGLIYDESLDDKYQKVYVGGTFEVVPIEDADVSLMEYFNFLNVGRNMWFTNLIDARAIMDPTLGIKFVQGEMAIRDKRNSKRIPFKYKIDAFEENLNLGTVSFKKRGKSTWTLCQNMEAADKNIDDLISIQGLDDSFKFGFILEKYYNGKAQKAIYGMDLEPETDFEYDEIIDAGYLGYLVRKGANYSYIFM